ncbi:fimbria/pilus periplasmic chaperone [Atlantibacter hermannii]|nr:fimbria/pilus periplasmic chaperone [Atlantibacter hermannii]
MFYRLNTMFKRIASIALMTALFSTGVSAAMTISGTRIIFPGAEKEVNVRTNNRGKTPALVQVWVDDGKTNGDVNTIKSPFILTSPVYRVEPGRGQSVRLIFNGMTLPQDRESVFWFNMLEIPPVSKEDDASKNKLDLAFRTRIKIFYRPENLTSNGEEEISKLKWALISSNEGKKRISIENPTPYFFSFDSAKLKSGNITFDIDIDMVAPFTRQEFNVTKNISANDSITGIDFRSINDYGAGRDHHLDYNKKQGFLPEGVVSQ